MMKKKKKTKMKKKTGAFDMKRFEGVFFV